jgi:hypothetical protein
LLTALGNAKYHIDKVKKRERAGLSILSMIAKKRECWRRESDFSSSKASVVDACSASRVFFGIWQDAGFAGCGDKAA